MESDRVSRFFSPTPIILMVLAGAVLLSSVFFFFWQKLNNKVEVILREQFNQQQLMLARKIADNVESYFDYLENELLRYSQVFGKIRLQTLGIEVPVLEEWFARLKPLGILELRRYDALGRLQKVFPPGPAPPGETGECLPPDFQEWVQDPENQGRLFLSKTCTWTNPPWQGRRVMRMLTPLYESEGRLAGVLELLINPLFICCEVTADVRSGQSGYAWIIDQDVILLAHFEKTFVGYEGMAVRIARDPKIVFRGLPEIHANVLAGKEGVGDYDSGWHRQKDGLTTKLVAYTPVRFNKGLIRGVTDVEAPARNRWGVAVVAPVGEVSGNVAEVMHQELFLVGTFAVLVLLGTAVLIGIALIWNKTLTREIDLKNRECIESQERLLHSERFAAVGEAAAYVSHEIKNPLMVIGGLAHQVERRVTGEPADKLKIIQNEVKRLETFLEELRDFTRPVSPVMQVIDLNQVIREVEALMTGATREKGINLVIRLDPRLPRLKADPNQLKQVLVNLIKNALEATGRNGQIFLSSGYKDDLAWFSVRDTGKGMPPEILENIFHPFFTTKDKGTGLGLAVTHKIISDHHGFVQVDSSPGRGSTFLIKLPLS